MKKSGMSLIEVIVSVALISILAVSILGIIAISSGNIFANGKSIHNINDAKKRLDVAMFEEISEPPTGVVNATDERTFAELGGARVKTRYITSTIFDPTGKNISIPSGSEEFLYVFQYDGKVIGTPKEEIPAVYLDKNKNGEFDSATDEAVPLSSLGHMGKSKDKTFTVQATENLVFDGSVYLESAYGTAAATTEAATNNCLLKLIINAPNSDVIFKDGSRVVCNGGVTINAKNITMTNSQLSSPRQWTYGWNFNISIYYYTTTYPAVSGTAMYVTIYLNASEKLVVDNCQIYAPFLRLSGTNRLEIINGSDLTVSYFDTYATTNNIHIDSKDILISGNKDNTTTFNSPEHFGFYRASIYGITIGDTYSTTLEEGYVCINEGLSANYNIQLGDKSRGGSYQTKSYVQFVRYRDGLSHWEAHLHNPGKATFKTGSTQGIAPVYRSGSTEYFK